MKLLLMVTATVILLHSCSNEKPVNDLLRISNLPSQYFTINSSADTILRTSHASTFRIKKGTFGDLDQVKIEIKEALTPAEIIAAGLTTTSNGKPLQSGGMIYFNASNNGKNIEPQLPIETTVPAKNADSEMQLFIGEIESDSSVNWTDPEPLAVDTINKRMYELGRQIFNAKCASCHSPFHDATGPQLRNFQTKSPWNDFNNLRDWIHNPAVFMATNLYTQDLKEKFASMMQAFPDVSDSAILGIVAYVNTVTREDYFNDEVFRKVYRDSATTTEELPDICETDTIYSNFPNYYPEYDPSQVSPTTEVYIQEKYDFSIKTNGWYNIDKFLKTEPDGDIQDVSLSAVINSPEKINPYVYLAIPTEKVLQGANNHRGDIYYFRFNGETTPLPLKERAIIFVFGSTKDKMYYGITEFIIQKEQSIQVELKETTKEELQRFVVTNKLDGVELNAFEKQPILVPINCDSLNRARPSKDTVKVIAAGPR